MITIEVEADEVIKNLQPREVRNIAQRALEDTAEKIEKDFNSITRTWDHKVDVEVEIDTRRGRYEMLVGTDDKIMGYLEHGTKKNYPIVPKRAKALRFMSGFRPKTTPRSLQSGQGGSFGKQLFRKGVIHPGIKPRRWMPKIAKRAQKYADKAFKKSIEKWIRQKW